MLNKLLKEGAHKEALFKDLLVYKSVKYKILSYFVFLVVMNDEIMTFSIDPALLDPWPRIYEDAECAICMFRA